MRIRSAHLEILGFPISDAYQYRVIFARFKTIPEKVDLSKYSWYPKRTLGVPMHFEIIKLQFEKERHTLLCILKIFTNIIHELCLKNAWLPPISFLNSITLVKIYISCIITHRGKNICN